MSGRSTAMKAGAALVVLLGLVAATTLPGRGALHTAVDAATAARWEDAEAALVPSSPAVRSALNLRDLGTLHALQGHNADALAAWRAAHLLSPRDADVIHDLTLVRSQLGKGVPEPVAPPRAWMEVLSPSELALLACAAWFVTSVLAWRAHRGQADARVAVVAGVLATALAAPALDGLWRAAATTFGVVRTEVSVREVPDPQAAVHHTLPVGAEVYVLSQQGDFALVEDGRGRRGWAVAASVATAPR